MPFRTVVTVVTFNNSPQQLALYARALKIAASEAATRCETALLYLDNGAESGLRDQVGFAHHLPNDANVGYGPALAKLLEHAFGPLQADLVVTSNPDGAFHHACIATLAARAAAAPGQLLEARQFPDEHPKGYDPQSGDTPWASGCCVAISRTVFTSVGNVDPLFWLYLEDVDYAWRARARGIPVRTVHDALYAHDVAERPSSEVARRQMLLSGRRLGIKWRNARFTRECERLLRAEFPTELSGMEAVETIEPIPAAWTRVADFRHYFSFARTRW